MKMNLSTQSLKYPNELQVYLFFTSTVELFGWITIIIITCCKFEHFRLKFSRCAISDKDMMNYLETVKFEGDIVNHSKGRNKGAIE